MWPEGWLLTGLFLCRAGFAYQLWRDYRRHGLTYVSGVTILLLVVGSAALAIYGLTHADPVLVVVALAPGGGDLLVLGLKGRDWVCTRLRIPVGGHHRGTRR